MGNSRRQQRQCTKIVHHFTEILGNSDAHRVRSPILNKREEWSPPHTLRREMHYDAVSYPLYNTPARTPCKIKLPQSLRKRVHSTTFTISRPIPAIYFSLAPLLFRTQLVPGSSWSRQLPSTCPPFPSRFFQLHRVRFSCHPELSPSPWAPQAALVKGGIFWPKERLPPSILNLTDCNTQRRKQGNVRTFSLYNFSSSFSSWAFMAFSFFSPNASVASRTDASKVFHSSWRRWQLRSMPTHTYYILPARSG